MEIARLRNNRIVVRIDAKVTALQHPGERPDWFASRCNALAQHIMGNA